MAESEPTQLATITTPLGDDVFTLAQVSGVERLSSLFEFEVSVAPDRAAEVVDGILRFARSASRFQYTDTELKRALRRYRYAMEFMDDSPADLASWFGRASLFGVERQMATLGQRMNGVSGADIRQAARKTFVRRGLVLTAVGELARGEWNRVRTVVARWPRS